MSGRSRSWRCRPRRRGRRLRGRRLVADPDRDALVSTTSNCTPTVPLGIAPPLVVNAAVQSPAPGSRRRRRRRPRSSGIAQTNVAGGRLDRRRRCTSRRPWNPDRRTFEDRGGDRLRPGGVEDPEQEPVRADDRLGRDDLRDERATLPGPSPRRVRLRRRRRARRRDVPLHAARSDDEERRRAQQGASSRIDDGEECTSRIVPAAARPPPSAARMRP